MHFTYLVHVWFYLASLVAQVKNPPASARNARDLDSIPESGHSPGVGPKRVQQDLVTKQQGNND